MFFVSKAPTDTDNKHRLPLIVALSAHSTTFTHIQLHLRTTPSIHEISEVCHEVIMKLWFDAPCFVLLIMTFAVDWVLKTKCPAACLTIYLSVYLSIYLSMYLSIYIFIHPSIYISIHPSIYPSIELRKQNPSISPYGHVSNLI